MVDRNNMTPAFHYYWTDRLEQEARMRANDHHDRSSNGRERAASCEGFFQFSKGRDHPFNNRSGNLKDVIVGEYCERETTHGHDFYDKTTLMGSTAGTKSEAPNKEARNTPFCPLQEKFHTVVLRRLRNISEAP